jgi:hypothetical protein
LNPGIEIHAMSRRGQAAKTVTDLIRGAGDEVCSGSRPAGGRKRGAVLS